MALVSGTGAYFILHHFLTSNRSLHFEATPSAWRPEGLHVGMINVTTERLATDLYIGISIVGFNATRSSISVVEAIGNIYLRGKIGTESDSDTPLPTPRIAYEIFNARNVADLSPIYVHLEQRLFAEAARIFPDRIDKEAQVYLDLKLLDLKVSPTHQPECKERLPLWHGVTVFQAADRPITGKVIEASAHMGAKMAAAPGLTP